jgi:hypothetical protein
MADVNYWPVKQESAAGEFNIILKLDKARL